MNNCKASIQDYQFHHHNNKNRKYIDLNYLNYDGHLHHNQCIMFLDFLSKRNFI